MHMHKHIHMPTIQTHIESIAGAVRGTITKAYAYTLHVYIYIYICIHIDIHTFKDISIHSQIFGTCIIHLPLCNTSTHMHMHTPTHLHTRFCIYVHTYDTVLLHVYIYICAYK